MLRPVSDEGSAYRPVSRPYRKRFSYQYRRHVFDKLRAIDLPLREFQALLGEGEVVAEAGVGLLAHKDVLLVQWVRPLHVAIVVDEQREEERIVTVYEPDPSEWTNDFRRRR
jgi:hypothetical protein